MTCTQFQGTFGVFTFVFLLFFIKIFKSSIHGDTHQCSSIFGICCYLFLTELMGAGVCVFKSSSLDRVIRTLVLHSNEWKSFAESVECCLQSWSQSQQSQKVQILKNITARPSELPSILQPSLVRLCGHSVYLKPH